MYILYWYWSYTETLLSLVFIFTSFNTTPLILLVKIILIRICKSVKDSGGLMRVCRWVTVDARLQKKIPFNNSSTEPTFIWWWIEHQMNVWNLLKADNKNTRMMPLTCRFGVITVNFIYISHLALVLLVFLYLLGTGKIPAG